MRWRRGWARPPGRSRFSTAKRARVRSPHTPEGSLVVAAIVGAAGLAPTLAALQSGKRVGLANKETLVIAGDLMRKAADASGAEILPIDSEHSALMQCLRAGRREEVKRLILTASGGPFLDFPLERFGEITLQQALKHPNWEMGPKITIDSATMMNKGLEVIEARWLFDAPPEEIDVLIHPQSVVHSMVEYVDGAIIAQLGVPDMRQAIAYAMAHPNRIALPVPPLDLTQKPLEFRQPDLAKFPLLGLAYQALSAGGAAPAVLNAANETAVAAFLEGRIAFPEIHRIVAATLESHPGGPADSLEAVLEADDQARREASALSTS